MTGMEGKGRVQTSSPFSSSTARPAPSNTATAMPSCGACISPRWTAPSGFAPTKQPQRSVPPDMEATAMSAFARP